MSLLRRFIGTTTVAFALLLVLGFLSLSSLSPVSITTNIAHASGITDEWGNIIEYDGIEIENGEAVQFLDVEGEDPSYEGISYLKRNGIVHGYDDGSFKSTNKINRAEFLKIVIGSLPGFNLDAATSRNCFSDVKEEWFAPYVCYAKDQGIVSGYPDGTFKPAENINFAEASKIVANAFDLEANEVNVSDPWYRKFVDPLAQRNAIPVSVSDLDKKIARGEMAELMYRVRDQKQDKDSLNYHDLEGLPYSGQTCDALYEMYEQMPRHRYFELEEEAMEVDTAMPVMMDAVAESAPTTGSAAKSATDFSTTNIQVEGVDEADFIKNDGKYIYVITDGELVIVDAYPADQMEVISRFNLDEDDAGISFSPSNMYINGEQLVLMGYEHRVFDHHDTPHHMFRAHQSMTAVYILDISDRTAPEVTRKLKFDGNEISSRRVGQTLYLVLRDQKYNNFYYLDEAEFEGDALLPMMTDSERGEEEVEIVGCGDVMYFPRMRSVSYVIAAAIPLNNNNAVEAEVVLGDYGTVFASKQNLYLASTNYDSDNGFYHDHGNAKTVVHRFDLSPGDIEYEGRGKVPGTILNQFSLDEYENHLRIATTSGNFWGSGENISKNNLYILNSDMNIVGSIENIAPGERIYSTRFMGARGYMVTFKKVDPLFAFDLSDPANPKILGKLKIPGYSDYLHPYDENHIIGFGKDAVDASIDNDGGEITLPRGGDFAWYQGMKIALFDVTDPTNPKQLHTELIGDRGTNSDILYNHKALLFDRERNLLAFPVEVSEVKDKENKPANAWGETIFDGAYVYHLDLKDGFQLRGTVSHYSQEDEDYLKAGDYWYGDWHKKIARLLYMDDTLYSVSRGYLKANELDSLDEIKMIDLNPYEFDYEDEIYEEDGIIPRILPLP